MPEPDTSQATAVPYTETDAFAQARSVLAGTDDITGAQALALVKRLRNEMALGPARDIARRYRLREKDDSLAFELLRVEVTSTYKDPEVSTDEGLAGAWQSMLDAGYDPRTLQPTGDEARDKRVREVLGLAGAIKKRWWEYDGRVDHLTASLVYYQRAYGSDVGADDGYQAINAAYVLDLLASLEPPARARTAPGADTPRRDDAEQIRRQLVTSLSAVAPRSWWASSSLAQAHFGLGQYDQAVAELEEALAKARQPDWELETTMRQMASLARIQCRIKGEDEPAAGSPAWQALVAAFGVRVEGVRSAFVGKIGLALSGGGFRASLYHIGVLARLAELDVLRHVEVLSCVSGGSIIGAHYYLELRHLLESTPNAEITQKDYVALVERIETAFLKGVQGNVRLQLFGETSTAWSSAWDPKFSQTGRLGDLFEEQLFAEVEDDGQRLLNGLFIRPNLPPDPTGDPKRAFNPRAENWKLAAKVPILVLNATSLNTGHTWQFTTSFMGEPRGVIDTTIDANPRLRRVRFHSGPDGYRTFRLGHAVAASAAVPSIFEPLPLADLYAKRMMVRLADGGVYDNQGVAGLLEQGCTYLIVSDASGQSELVANPSRDRIGVARTANDILMARVRGLQFDLLKARLSARTLRGVAFVHLMQDLDGGTLNQRGSRTASSAPASTPLTPYRMRRDIQEKLARLRTDLDAFSDFEAFALMMSGYRAIDHQFHEQASFMRVLDAGATRATPGHDGDYREGTWRFSGVEPFVTTDNLLDTDYSAMCALLSNGQHVLWKVEQLYPRGAVFTGLKVLGLAAIVALIAWFWALAAFTLGVLALAVVAIGVLRLAWRAIRPTAPREDATPRASIPRRLSGIFWVGAALWVRRRRARDTPRYLAFGSFANQAFLSNSRKRWPLAK